MKTFGILVTVLVVAAAGRGQGGSEVARTAFRDDLDRARALCFSGQWSRGLELIDAMLAGLENRDVARAHRMEIERLIRHGEIAEKVEEPDPRTLISGELVRFNGSTGDVEIRYRKDGLGDWEKTEGDDPGEPPRFLFPALFTGPYTIELRGSRYPATGPGPALHLGVGSDMHFWIQGGTPPYENRWWPALLQLRKGEDGEWNGVDEQKISPGRPGKPFSFQAEVTKGAVRALYDGREFLNGRKPTDAWGRPGFRGLEVEEVILRGPLEPFWIQGKIDAAVRERLTSIERSFDIRKRLPAWLFEPIAPAPGKAEPEARWPGHLSSRDYPILEKLDQLMQARSDAEGLEIATSADESRLPEVARAYYRGTFLRSLERHEEAHAEYERILVLDSEWAWGRQGAAWSRAATGDYDGSLTLLRKLVEEFPGSEALWSSLVDVLLEAGRFSEARETITDALLLGLRAEAFAEPQRVVVNALSGPLFHRRFEFTSEHYHVVSDIDKKTCAEAAKILEESYLAYNNRVQRVKKPGQDLFHVYLFSGEIGYAAYRDEITWASIGHETTGMYVPSVKQLLIRNTYRRESMMQVVRHEGFHQFLDHVLNDPATWFDEGHAEYYESAEFVAGRWKLGEIRRDHLETLASGILPMGRFLYAPYSEFHQDWRTHYAQSWAFVHFLSHGPKKWRPLLDAFWRAFREAPWRLGALDRALKEVDVEALDHDFRDYVKSL